MKASLFSSDLLDRIAIGTGDISGQRPGDFRLASDTHLRDEIQRSFSDARVYWDAFNRRLERSRESRTTLTRQDWASELFELLGFEPLEYQRSAIDLGGVPFAISHRTHKGETAPPVHIVAVDQRLDERGSGNRRTPHALVQDYLNRSEALWGVVTNGAKLRLLRDSARQSKPTYLEFDLESMMEGNTYSEFVILYRLLHATRFPEEEKEPHECLLENYYTQGIEEGGRVRDKLRVGVKRALEILGSALIRHPDNEALRNQILNGLLSETAYYRELLRFVYRMLFLMVTEERKLLFKGGDGTGSAKLQHQTIYERYYSISRLRDRAERYYAGDSHGDLWQGLAQTFRLFREQKAADQLGLSPLNGELFSQSACINIEQAFCPNESFLAAVQSLSTFDDDKVRRRVSYAHLDVEEFGSVYESLLDYGPFISLDPPSGAQHNFELLAGNERKQTGSYYTPPDLVRALMESALVPVMEERLAKAKTPQDKEKALLDLRVCDPASGSGHFLLAAARRIARELAKVRTGEEEPSPTEYRSAIRDVVRNSIYAVDKNPLAVDLCKVALWIEGHAAGLPLSFLDHHIKCGDSLVGVSDLLVLAKGIPDGAYKPVTGDDKDAAKEYRQRNKKERVGQRSLDAAIPVGVAEEFATFGQLEEHTASEVQAKVEMYQQLRGTDTDWYTDKVSCDMWTAAFFLPLIEGSPSTPQVPTTDIIRKWRESRAVVGTLTGRVVDAAERNAFFHWPMEFPDVLNRGGFDVVLGNPPWERIKLQEKEFFAERDRDIASAPNKAAREHLIRDLPSLNPELATEFARAQHDAESTSRFVRESGRFPLTGRGDVNTYSIFAETARSICGPTGRVGMIVPSGIATDDTTKQFFSDIVDKRSLVSLFDFENREGVFPGVHRSYKFCLLTLSGANRPTSEAEFAFYLYQTEQLREPLRRFSIASEDFGLFNPNTRTCPTFRIRRDMEVARKLYLRAGVFWKEARDGHAEVNPWQVTFRAMFHMSNDSGLFRTREQLEAGGWRLNGNVFVRGEEHYLPLYEAKLFHQYDHRFATFEGADDKALDGGNARETTSKEKKEPDSVVTPRYWVPEKEVADRLGRSENGVTRSDAQTLRRLADSARRSLSGRSHERPTSGRESSP